MSVQFTFPELRSHHDRLPLVSLTRPRWSDKDVDRLLARMRVGADAKDMGELLVARGRSSTLEIYRASHSFRWSHRKFDRENAAEPVDLTDEQALELAATHVDQLELDGSVLQTSVGRTELVRQTRRQAPKAETAVVTAVHVSYRFAVDDVPVFGPGAKAQLSFGAGGSLGECYRFWRNGKVTGETPIMSPEAAAERFTTHVLFDGVEEGRATIHAVEPGLLSLTPVRLQGELLPVYRITGVLSTPLVDEYRFDRCLIAAELRDDEAKERGIVGGRSTELIQ